MNVDAQTAELPPFVDPGIESVCGQAPYPLPRDHAMHGGKFYQANDFIEWQYVHHHPRLQI